LRPRGILAGLGLVLILGASASVPVRTPAQEAASEVTKRKVKTRVTPEYTDLARQMKATGKVKIEVTISPDGRVTSTRTVGGNPILVAASLDALKKWRFEPGPKETMEIIEFDFSDPH
jgi:TonB family protein